MHRFPSIFFALALLPIVPGRGDTPVRYDVTAAVASVPASGGASFGTKFFFTTGNRVAYRVIPAGQTEADPAAQWEFWSSALGGRTIAPAAGYASVDVRGINAGGAAVGQTLNNAEPHQEAALYWTAGNGSTVPTEFDPGYSLLEFINAAGRTAGSTYSVPLSGPEKVRWDAAAPGDPPVAIPLPAGYDYGEIRGLSDNGDVLLYVKDSVHDVARAAVWDGGECATVGPAPDDGETFYGSNVAIDALGNVAILMFTPGVSCRLHYVSAAHRDTWQTFTFAAPDSSAYNLRIGGGSASFDTASAGTNFVNIALAALAQHRTFAGYRSYLNASGALIFGAAGNLNFWDTAAAAGEPATVPVSIQTSSGGLDVVGFNDEGRVLVLNTLNGSRSLSILSPAFPQPTRLRVVPVRKKLKLTAGLTVHSLLVTTRLTGDPPPGKVRFVRRGKLPAGLRFRAADGVLLGKAKRAGHATLRIAATYRSAGKLTKTSEVTIKVSVRKASPPTQ